MELPQSIDRSNIGQVVNAETDTSGFSSSCMFVNARKLKETVVLNYFNREITKLWLNSGRDTLYPLHAYKLLPLIIF